MDYMGAIRDESPLTNCSVKIQNTVLTLSYNSRLLCGNVITQSRSTKNCQNFVTKFKTPAISIEEKIYAFVIFQSIFTDAVIYSFLTILLTFTG